MRQNSLVIKIAKKIVEKLTSVQLMPVEHLNLNVNVTCQFREGREIPCASRTSIMSGHCALRLRSPT